MKPALELDPVLDQFDGRGIQAFLSNEKHKAIEGLRQIHMELQWTASLHPSLKAIEDRVWGLYRELSSEHPLDKAQTKV
jgi:hypothetical protein